MKECDVRPGGRCFPRPIWRALSWSFMEVQGKRPIAALAAWGIVRHTGPPLAATLGLQHKPETWMKFVVVPLARGRWVWVMRDADGLTVCESATSYISRERAFSAIHEVRAKASDAEIAEPPETGSDPLS